MGETAAYAGNPGLFSNRDFDLYNIIFHPVYYIFVDPHLVGKFMEFQIVFLCKGKNFFIPPGDQVPVPFVESSQVSTLGRYVQAAFIGQKRNLDKQLGIIVKESRHEADLGQIHVLMFASSLYTGYSYGAAPMFSYYYGEQNRGKLKTLVSLSLKVIGVISAATAAGSFLLTRPLVSVFARPFTFLRLVSLFTLYLLILLCKTGKIGCKSERIFILQNMSFVVW